MVEVGVGGSWANAVCGAGSVNGEECRKRQPEMGGVRRTDGTSAEGRALKTSSISAKAPARKGSR